METGVADDDGWITVGPDGEPITDTNQEVKDDYEDEKPDLAKLVAQTTNSYRLKFNAESPRVQTVPFVKLDHSVSPDVPGNKSLVMSKIPPWATTQSLKGLLDTKCGDGNGKVKAVYFVKKLDDAADFTPGFEDPSVWPPVDTDGSLIRGFKCAFVVFEKASGCRAVTAALEKNATEEPLVLSTPERPVATGLKKWKREYNARLLHAKPDLDNLAENIKAFVAQMDAAREAAKAKAAAEAEPDEGGWVTVSRHSGKAKRKPLGLGTKTGQAKIKARDAKRRKRKEMLDFYKFQTKEEKLDRLKELKSKFEEDKQKQIKLKQDRQQRKFNS